MLKKLEEHYDRKFDQFNDAGTRFHDSVLLTEIECEQLITAINKNLLVESGNKTAKYLRQLLSLSIDIQQTEDALCKLKGISIS